MLKFQKQEKNKRNPRNSKTPSWHAHAYNSGEWSPRPHLGRWTWIRWRCSSLHVMVLCDGATISYIYVYTHTFTQAVMTYTLHQDSQSEDGAMKKIEWTVLVVIKSREHPKIFTPVHPVPRECGTTLTISF
jgi:hypothetical protein